MISKKRLSKIVLMLTGIVILMFVPVFAVDLSSAISSAENELANTLQPLPGYIKPIFYLLVGGGTIAAALSQVIKWVQHHDDEHVTKKCKLIIGAILIGAIFISVLPLPGIKIINLLFHTNFTW